MACREEPRWCLLASRAQISKSVWPSRSVSSSRITRRVGSASALKTSAIPHTLGKCPLACQWFATLKHAGAQRSTIEDVRRFDPHRTPQELQPAKVPTVTMFGIGTLAWMAVLLVLGARHVLGYGVYGPMAGVAVAGILLGVGGMLWGSTRGQKGGSATGLPPAKTTTQQPGPTTPQSERPAQEPDRPGRQSERAPESGA